jgi:hypothetical protein
LSKDATTPARKQLRVCLVELHLFTSRLGRFEFFQPPFSEPFDHQAFAMRCEQLPLRPRDFVVGPRQAFAVHVDRSREKPKSIVVELDIRTVVQGKTCDSRRLIEALQLTFSFVAAVPRQRELLPLARLGTPPLLEQRL